jgi:hypothetical protein
MEKTRAAWMHLCENMIPMGIFSGVPSSARTKRIEDMTWWLMMRASALWSKRGDLIVDN